VKIHEATTSNAKAMLELFYKPGRESDFMAMEPGEIDSSLEERHHVFF